MLRQTTASATSQSRRIDSVSARQALEPRVPSTMKQAARGRASAAATSQARGPRDSHSRADRRQKLLLLSLEDSSASSKQFALRGRGALSRGHTAGPRSWRFYPHVSASNARPRAERRASSGNETAGPTPKAMCEEAHAMPVICSHDQLRRRV